MSLLRNVTRKRLGIKLKGVDMEHDYQWLFWLAGICVITGILLVII